ncbi:glycosyltransferase [Knoellia sp. CPCC 206435]|uniref:glycosyltransferase n=1 Tax=Knoellia terrae TaxID=3404797 RepID=UPI003B43063F
MAVFRPSEERFLRQVRTLQEQTISDWVCIIGIDGADPLTRDKAIRLTGADPRFTVHEFESNVGFYRNFERLLAMVSPETAWIALADQDDEWDRDKLKVLTEALRLQGVPLALCQARIVNAAGAVIGTTGRQRVGMTSLLLNNQITGSLAAFRPLVAKVALPFPEPTAASYHDHWLGMVAQALGGYALVDEQYQNYIQHGDNVLGEELGPRLRSRAANLFRGGPSAAIERLIHERWGWRRRMAIEIQQRLPSTSLPKAVNDIAHGSFTPAVCRALIIAVQRDDLPPSRALSLGCAAFLTSLSRLVILKRRPNRVTPER